MLIFFRRYTKAWHMLYKSGKGSSRIRYAVLGIGIAWPVILFLQGEHGMRIDLKIIAGIIFL
jgi:hypothetical protein